MAYPPAIEALRPTVQKYFKPEDVDKALYVIYYESQGNPDAVGDSGSSIGLFQLNGNGLGSGLSVAQRRDPETNIKTAAQAVYGGSGWKPWGENNTYNGQKFGSLGDHPYSQASAAKIGGGSGVAGNIIDRTQSSIADTTQRARDAATGNTNGGIDTSGLFNSGGSSSGGTPDWYYSGQLDLGQQGATLDRDKFNQDNNNSMWDHQQTAAEFEWKKAQDDRDYALAVGDLDLARQKQASADYWEGKTLEVQQGMNSADNSRAIAVAQMEAQSQIQSATIAAESQRYDAQLRLQSSLASAHNEQEQNKILLTHEREMANIAKMEDDTKRAIAGRQSQIDSFNAETSRATGMGQIALENNKFILDASNTPSDLFGLYFMQRGWTPDWNSLAAGNAPTQGDPLKVYDPMKAYVPQTQLPTNFDIGQGQSYGSVGQAANSTSLTENPFMNMNQVQAPSFGGGGSAGGGAGGGMPTSNYNAADYGVNVGHAPTVPQTQITPNFYDRNPGGKQGGVPLAGLKPGMNLSTVGGDTKGTDFTMPAYYDEGKSRPVGANDVLKGGTQVYVDYSPTNEYQGPPGRIAPNPDFHQLPDVQGTITGPNPNYQILPDIQGKIVPHAEGGYMHDTLSMTGDARGQDPFRGAKPELIYNPTNAPIGVFKTEDTKKMMKPKRYATGTMQADYGNIASKMSGFQGTMNQMMQKSPLGGTAPGAPPMPQQPQLGGGMGVPMHTMGMQPQQPRVPFQPGFNGQPQQDFPNAGLPQNFQRNGNVVTPTAGTGQQNWGMMADYGVAPPQYGSQGYNQYMNDNMGNRAINNGYNMTPEEFQQAHYEALRQRMSQMQNYGRVQQQGTQLPPGYGAQQPQFNNGWQQSQFGQGRMMNNYDRGLMDNRYANGTMSIPRYADGSTMQAYQNLGLGQLYLQGSDNQNTQGMWLPDKLQMLKNYGTPITPGLASSVTGQTSPALNVASAFQQRGGGVLPSLQTLNGQTEGETGLFKGYVQGPVGMSFNDTMAGIMNPTSNLQQANRGRMNF